jgi:hypothetical protein
MKFPAKSVAWLLPLLLTACFHVHLHRRQQPAQAYSPPVFASPMPATTPVELPPSELTIPSQPLASEAGVMPQQKLKRPKKRWNAISKNDQQAASEVPGVSAVGELSSGAPSDLRRETMDSIAATERGLGSIDRALNDQEQKTAAQIREFLKQAREALTSGDVDGAHTLAAKAKVLLSELTS